MIIVSGKVKVVPGAIDRVRDMMESNIRATREEAGCVDYSYGADVLDPDTIILLEYWDDWAALEAHFTKPHTVEWMKAFGKADVVSRDIKFIEAGEERNPFG